MKTLADKLRAWRKARQLSQWQAGEVLAVPVRTLQEWEQGRYAPRGFTLKALLAILDRETP